MRKLSYSFIILIFTSLHLYSQSTNLFYGVQTHLQSYLDSLLMEKILDSIKSAGIQAIRDECYWSEVEKIRGVYTFPKYVDDYIKAAKRKGIDVLMILDYNNPLYAPHAGSGVTTDSNRAAYAKYCQQVVARYAPLGVKYYEIWNEPNIPIFWDPTPNALDYVKLLQAAYPAIKQIDSTAIVIGCATSPAEGNPPPFISWLTFINQVYSQGGGNYMDVVSFHQYRVDKKPELWLENDINSIKAIVGTKPLWITEVGYHTSNVWPYTSLQNQANYISRMYLMGRGINKLDRIIYYDFRNDGENASDPEHNYGIVYYNLNPKPAYTFYKVMTSQIADKNYINQLKQGDNYKFTFSNSFETTYAIWNSTSLTQRTDLFNKNRLRVVTSNNETYFIFDKDRLVQLDYDEAPKYITELESFPSINRLEILPNVDTIVVGQKLYLKLIGYTNEMNKIFIDSSAVGWSTISSFVKIDSNGILTALGQGIATVTASFEGRTVNKDIVVLPSYTYLEIEPFNSLSRFTISYFNQSPSTNVSIIDTNYTSPASSAKIEYTFQYKGIDQHRVIFDCDYALIGEPDSILIDIFNNGNGHVMEFQIADRDGEIFRANTLQIPSTFGWRTAKISLLGFGSRFDYPARLKKMIFYTVKNSGKVDSTYSGTVLIDNLRIHGSPTTSTKNFSIQVPESFKLFQNYPNPFSENSPSGNPITNIRFQVPRQSHITLKVFDILGREVATLINENKLPGMHEIKFDIRHFARSREMAGGVERASGIYFYQLKANGFIETKKMIILK